MGDKEKNEIRSVKAVTSKNGGGVGHIVLQKGVRTKSWGSAHCLYGQSTGEEGCWGAGKPKKDEYSSWDTCTHIPSEDVDAIYTERMI